MCAAMCSAASSSAEPPISPAITISSVCPSAWNSSSTSTNEDPGTGSPPMPTIELQPNPACAISLPIW